MCPEQYSTITVKHRSVIKVWFMFEFNSVTVLVRNEGLFYCTCDAKWW